MILLYIAAILFIVYGFIEVSPLIFFRKKSDSELPMIPQFIFPSLRDNRDMVYAIGGVLGILRIIAAVGILMNLMWGFALGVILCIVTLTIMTFYLPAGVFDGVISGVILVLLLAAYFGSQSIL